MNIISIPGFSDPFSSISHFVGAFGFLVYGVNLVSCANGHYIWKKAVIVFVFSVVLLLSMSGTFHLLDPQSENRAILQRLDHASIFILIAGTFTAVHSILFVGFWRRWFLFLIWALAIAGITYKLIYFNELAEWLSLMFYLGLGWLGVLSAYQTHRLHGFIIIKPLLYGAAAYTLGATLEYMQTPVIIHGVIGAHELFHIAVLAGIYWHWQFVKNLLKLKEIS